MYSDTQKISRTTFRFPSADRREVLRSTPEGAHKLAVCSARCKQVPGGTPPRPSLGLRVSTDSSAKPGGPVRARAIRVARFLDDALAPSPSTRDRTGTGRLSPLPPPFH